MRFALAFAAILVVSWASHGESSEFKGYSGAAKSVKELSSAFESSRIVNPKADKNDEVIAPSGQKTSVQELIASYDSFKRSDSLTESGDSDSIPSVEQVETAIETGKKFDLDSTVCKIGAGRPGKPKKEWFEYLCF